MGTLSLCFTLMLLWLVSSTSSNCIYDDPAANQLEDYKEQHPDPAILSSPNGASVDIEELNTFEGNLMMNKFFMESIQHFNRERIPERVVHANGAGAFGYFEVTNDVADVCGAAFLNKIGKKTPVAVRFSTTVGESGSNELARDVRGFATRFYTEDGNFDLVGLHIPVFGINNPIYFPSLNHASKRNPQTNMPDNNMAWDFFTLRPEVIQSQIWLYSDFGLPYNLAYMNGYSVHTYQIYNANGESFFARFHIVPERGSKFLTTEEAANLTLVDPFHFTHQLYNDIENENFPRWQIFLQVLTQCDVENADNDVFDTTRSLPIKEFPLRPVGRLVLNRNPVNFFEDIEQLAFCPSNVVSGILGAPDKLFEARAFAYKNAQNYRLGINFENIPVNCPFAAKNRKNKLIPTYLQNGVPPDSNYMNAPNYFPNAFNGPKFTEEYKYKPKMITIRQSDTNNFDQSTEFYISLSKDAKDRLVNNLVASLAGTVESVRERVYKILNDIHPQLSADVQARYEAAECSLLTWGS